MGRLDTNMKKKRDIYNMGGLSTHKSIGDLDLTLSASGSDDYQRAGVGASYKGKGFQVRGEASTDRFGNRRHSVGVTKSINDSLSIGVESNEIDIPDGRGTRTRYTGVTVEKKF
tara:strand:+ start:431 stop:772 length:342 start_codon:yes stop_codon:yes gene_type:complete